MTGNIVKGHWEKERGNVGAERDDTHVKMPQFKIAEQGILSPVLQRKYGALGPFPFQIVPQEEMLALSMALHTVADTVFSHTQLRFYNVYVTEHDLVCSQIFVDEVILTTSLLLNVK